VKPLSIDACIERYGRIQGHYEGGLLWPKAPDWILPFPVPSEIVMTNSISKKPVYRIYCNKDTHQPLKKAFDLLIATGCHTELETFDGCMNVRWQRGMPGILSFHSYAVAIDLNARKNPMGTKGKWSDQFIECMKSAGFTYGGEFSKRPDPMHWELREIPE